MGTKTAEWRPGPSVCRCCLAEGCYKDISTEYFWMGKREVYAEMLKDTFDLTVAYSKSKGPNSHSRLICEQCIARLRDASAFKRQVRECERTFLQQLDPASSSGMQLEVTVEPFSKPVKIEDGGAVKEEALASDFDDADDLPDFGDDDDDDLDDQPLMALASKVPKKETVDITDLLDNAKATAKRKSSAKGKPPPAKKSKVIKQKVERPKQQQQEKKKKDVHWYTLVAQLNAKKVLKYTTAWPFRMPGNDMVCVYCCEDYQDPAKFRAHMRAEHIDFNVKKAFGHTSRNYEFVKVDCTDLACRICSEKFDTVAAISKHLLEAHNKEINLDVEIGLQVFKLGAERWVCAFCPTKLPSLRELSKHTNKHYHKFTCEHCGKSYINKENLHRHIRYGHSKFKICIKCKGAFPTLEARREHVLSSERCWPLGCNLCEDDTRFVNRRQRLEHMETVHGKTPKKYTCPECGQVFDKWPPYRAHFIASHTDGAYSCSLCDMKFGSKRSLSEHVVTHPSEKQFACNVCSRKFACKKYMLRHKVIHNEDKRFECAVCNKQFNQRVSWKSHMRSYHPDLVD